MLLPWDPDSQGIDVRTDSEVGSNERVNVWLYADNGIAGEMRIDFTSPMKYFLGWCMSDWTPLPVSPPTQTDKIWRITYNRAELRVVILCNDVEVLNVVLSDVCDWSDWRNYWEQKKITNIYFGSGDTFASDEYCLSILSMTQPCKYT